MKKRLFAHFIFILFLAGVFTSLALSADVPKLTKDELKALFGNPDLIIVDVRYDKHWADSDLKIKGALREDPEKIESWLNKYSKDKIIVFYCA